MWFVSFVKIDSQFHSQKVVNNTICLTKDGLYNVLLYLNISIMKKGIYIILLSIFSLTTLSAQTYQEFITKALDYTEKQEYMAAEQSYLAALRKEPGNAANSMLLINLGTVQRYIKKYDEALISYNAALAKYPDQPFMLHSRASLYSEMNRLGDALKDYETIIKNDSSDIDALYQRGILYCNYKLLEAAKSDFKSVLYFSPEHLKAKMGLILLQKLEGDWQGAEEAYTELLVKHKTNAELYFNRAECYLQLNKLARMQIDLNRAAELGYNHYSYYLLYGQLRLAQYDKRAAKSDFEKAIELGADEATVAPLLKKCK